MLPIIGTVWNAIGGNKLLPYLLIAALGIAIVLLVYLQAYSAGGSAEKLKRTTESLNNHYKEVQRRAAIQAEKSADARARLAERWSH